MKMSFFVARENNPVRWAQKFSGLLEKLKSSIGSKIPKAPGSVIRTDCSGHKLMKN